VKWLRESSADERPLDRVGKIPDRWVHKVYAGTCAREPMREALPNRPIRIEEKIHGNHESDPKAQVGAV
jgi:hypothetical protein